jgi:Ca2+-dependent lipid-binding protein
MKCNFPPYLWIISRLNLKILRWKISGVEISALNMNYYVEINVGSSSVRTTSKSASEPVWSESFKFEVDSNTRFARVEVINEEAIGQVLSVGVIEISLLSVNTDVVRSWYQLGNEKSASAGEIEIEISYNVEGSQLNAPMRALFDCVKSLPQIQITGKAFY